MLPDHKDGQKGHIIALRHRLIGGDWSPIGILALYNLRSEIVHGSVLNVSYYLDYWNLLVICFITIDRLVKLAKRNPAVQNLKDLIGMVETQDGLEGVINFLKTRRDINGQELRELARERLKELEQIT